MSGVVIIDSGGANLASLGYALQRLGVTATISADAAIISAAARVLLPGVGSAGDAMARLELTGLRRLLPTLQQPVLGICLGMQLLFDRSEENDATCLGIIPGTVRRLQAVVGRPVPHMGWNTLNIVREDPLLDGLAPTDYLYFVHSYFAAPASCTLANTDYGLPLSAVVRNGNFAGVQFHPERSGQPGARLLRNFLADRS